MAKQAHSAQFVNQSSVKVFVNGRPTVISVSARAIVEYEAFYHSIFERYILCVQADGEFIGWHCGERSNNIIFFERRSDALRLADVRNASWAVRRSLEVVA